MQEIPFEKPIFVTKPLLPELEHLFHQLSEVWEAAWLTNNGKKHQELESKLKDYLAVENLCLFNNGTIALITAIQALRLSGEVITTPFTFAATPHVLSWNGITPVFCDIDPQTLNIDPSKIESLISNKTTAILGVHTFGNPCDVQKIKDIADYYGLKVVYDAAHAFDLMIDEKPIGNFGDISMFSFHATKLFHTAEGGALTFPNSDFTNRINLLKNFGIKNEETVLLPGINGKLNELQASLGLCVLDILEKEREARRCIKEIYLDLLSRSEGIGFVKYDAKITKESLQYFPIIIDSEKFGLSRDELHSRLKDQNIITRKYFYPLCSDYACYKQLWSSEPSRLPIANQVSNNVLVLPFYSQLGVAGAQRVAEAILRLGNR